MTFSEEQFPRMLSFSVTIGLIGAIYGGGPVDYMREVFGYKAVVDAFAEFGRVVPMMTTAAGTIRPAKVLILGAGVAGLQAIATAKRMGAIVSVFDVRSVVKEQVQSLGATFVEVPAEADDGETKGGGDLGSVLTHDGLDDGGLAGVVEASI